MLVLEYIYDNECLLFFFLQIFKSVGSYEAVQEQGSRRLISFSLSGMFCSLKSLWKKQKCQPSGDLLQSDFYLKVTQTVSVPQFL